MANPGTGSEVEARRLYESNLLRNAMITYTGELVYNSSDCILPTRHSPTSNVEKRMEFRDEGNTTSGHQGLPYSCLFSCVLNFAISLSKTYFARLYFRDFDGRR